MRSFTSKDFQAAMHPSDPRIEELAYLRACLGPASELLAQHQPLSGPVLTERGIMAVEDALRTFEVSTVVYRFGTWVVTTDGIACLVRHFPLSYARLREEQEWEHHLAEQPWINLWDLLRALAVARHIEARRPGHTPPGGDGAHPS